MHNDRSLPSESQDAEEFVKQCYRSLLQRPPDEAGLGFWVDALQSGKRAYHDVLASFIGSAEYSQRFNNVIPADSDDYRLFSGYRLSDLTIFEEFRPKDIAATPGFVTDYIGSKTRMSILWDGVAALDGHLCGIPNPVDYFAHATEWLGTLKAVRSAGRSFSAMELGAGVGPWISAAGVAAHHRGIQDIFLLGVEADEARFADMRTNLADNGLTATLLQAAVGVSDGLARWPRLKDPRNDAGGRPLRVDGAKINDEDLKYRGDREEESVEIKVVSFGSLLERRKLWDLIHIDVQGTEDELCAAFSRQLTERVRWMVIGTHSRKLDGDVMNLLFRAGWHLEHEVPSRIIYRDGASSLIACTTHDGTQVWRNPQFWGGDS